MPLFIRLTIFVLLLLAAPRHRNASSQDITEFVWSSNGRYIAVGYGDGSIQIEDTFSGEILADIQAHSLVITEFAWNDNGSKLASGSSDETVKVWDWQEQKLLTSITDLGEPVSALAWQDDLLLLGFGGFNVDETFQVWDLNGEKVDSDKNTGAVIDFLWHPDGEVIALLGLNTIGLVDARTFGTSTLLELEEQPGENLVSAGSWSHDGRWIATGSRNGKVKLWDMTAQKAVQEFQATELQRMQRDDLFAYSVVGIAFSEDDKELTSITRDGRVRTWNLEDGRLITETILTVNIDFVRYSPFKGRLAISTVATDNASETLQIIVPDASIKKLEMMTRKCTGESQPDIISQTQDLQDLPEFIEQVKALPEGAVPAACAADLIAVAEAVIAAP
jgi:WD40 repeat protein